MTSIQLTHFDSAYATHITDNFNTSGVTRTPFKAIFNTNQAFRNVSKITLASVEIPVGFVNIRTGSTDTLTFVLNTVTYTIVLPEKNYVTIVSLINDLNTVLIGVVPNVIITLSSTTSLLTPYRLLFTFTGTTTTTAFAVVNTNFSRYVLGFRGGRDVLISSVTVTYPATISNWNLNFDNYLYTNL